MKNTYYLSICYYKLTYFLIKIYWNPYKFILNLNLLLCTITCLLYIYWVLGELNIIYLSPETIDYVDELDFSTIENTEVLELGVKCNKNTNNLIITFLNLFCSNDTINGIITTKTAFYKNNKLLDYVQLSVPPPIKNKLINRSFSIISYYYNKSNYYLS